MCRGGAAAAAPTPTPAIFLQPPTHTSSCHDDRQPTPPLRLLTVGDGDLSFSLSLKIAYPEISVTASSLVESPTELCKLYSNAANNSAELKESWKEQIIYKVDATHLKETIRDKYDMILFNHPHLGDSSLLKSESLAAQRHFSLLCHYFHSAVDILSEHGRIHVCLSGNQPKTRNVIEAATNCGLKCVRQESTSCPISKWLFQNGHNYQLADAKSHYKPPRKFRNGKLGSKQERILVSAKENEKYLETKNLHWML